MARNLALSDARRCALARRLLLTLTMSLAVLPFAASAHAAPGVGWSGEITAVGSGTETGPTGSNAALDVRTVYSFDGQASNVDVSADGSTTVWTQQAAVHAEYHTQSTEDTGCTQTLDGSRDATVNYTIQARDLGDGTKFVEAINETGGVSVPVTVKTVCPNDSGESQSSVSSCLAPVPYPGEEAATTVASGKTTLTGSYTKTQTGAVCGTQIQTHTVSWSLIYGGSPANRPPLANDDTFKAVSGPNTIPVLTNDSDPDSDALTITRIFGGPSHGTAAVSGATVTYTPARGYTGPDSFQYEISDGHGHLATATVSITVAAASKLTIRASYYKRGAFLGPVATIRGPDSASVTGTFNALAKVAKICVEAWYTADARSPKSTVNFYWNGEAGPFPSEGENPVFTGWSLVSRTPDPSGLGHAVEVVKVVRCARGWWYNGGDQFIRIETPGTMYSLSHRIVATAYDSSGAPLISTSTFDKTARVGKWNTSIYYMQDAISNTITGI